MMSDRGWVDSRQALCQRYHAWSVMEHAEELCTDTL